MAQAYQNTEAMDHADRVGPEPACEWAVAIIAARENIATLTSTISAAAAACNGHDATIDVIINGNPALADTLARSMEDFGQYGASSITLRIWSLSLGDKAHAWNQYVHTIWPGSDIVYFVDGYARAQPDAFSLIAEALLQTPDAMGGAAVPSVGRSAKALAQQMITEGGMHGNLHALRGAVLQQFRDRNFYLPLGLYRGEATVGSVLAFRLDPAANKWDVSSVVVQPGATWWFEPSSIWDLQAIVSQIKRRFRQARGTLENRAVRQHLSINKHAPEQFPETADEMICNWIRDFPDETRRLYMANPLCWWEARKARLPQDWSNALTAPELLAETKMG